ncbi:hypothetical protein GGI20_004197 [Coemansia sp. BCRC 34301]|nr:hypothetical protein GGI20_004197 [Coemansia sp. BCRC 34301]
MLWRYLHSTGSASQLLSELLDHSDKRTHANAVFILGRLEQPENLREFAENVCTSGLSEFWRKAHTQPEEGVCGGLAAKWVLSKEPPTSDNIVEWWEENTFVCELLELALRNALHVERPRTSNLQGPSLSTRDLDRVLNGKWLLTAEIGYAIHRALPSYSRQSWTCAYSSRHGGRSWSTFQGAIESRGSVLLLLREKRGGLVFGAYLDGDVVKVAGWHGTSENFLFAVDKSGLRVYRATGFNDHYQYFNYARETMPNGLGVGGQMGHFGVWIDEGFSRGSSGPTATYDSPQLSAQRDFAIGSVEAWIVRASGGEDLPAKVSAVKANPDAVALLEMANRPMYSQ